MDLSAIVVVVAGSALLFGFIGWLAIYSRKNHPKKKSPAEIAEIDFSKVRKKNKRRPGKQLD